MIYTVKRGDIVFVNSGEDKGKTGKVLKVNKKANRIVVEKINMIKKHLKPTQENPKGGIVDKEAAIHASNIQIFCSSCNKGVKVGSKEENGKKIRFCRSCNKEL